MVQLEAPTGSTAKDQSEGTIKQAGVKAGTAMLPVGVVPADMKQTFDAFVTAGNAGGIEVNDQGQACRWLPRRGNVGESRGWLTFHSTIPLTTIHELSPAGRDGYRCATPMTTTPPYVEAEPFDLALIHYYRRPTNWSEYKRLVTEGVRAGDPLAEYAMATWHLFGQPDLGVRKSAPRAMPLLRKAARTLNRAMYELAVCQLAAEGTPYDPRSAVRLLERAADLGCVAAMRAFANCLEYGTGIRRDVKRAARLRRRAMSLSTSKPTKRRRSAIS